MLIDQYGVAVGIHGDEAGRPHFCAAFPPKGVKPNFSEKARDASRSLTVKLIENAPSSMTHSLR